MITTPSPAIVEALSHAGLDWLFLDAEHSAISTRDVCDLIRAAGGRCASVVRVAENSEVEIKRALDAGADGIIVPLVNSASEARRAVACARYPPLGTRGVGIGRAQGYGAHLQDYIATANERVAVIVQVEHIEAVGNLDEIIGVAGVDGVFVGPYDLSGSMNLLGQIGHPDVTRAIEEVYRRGRESGMPIGAFVPGVAQAASAIASGVSLLAVGSETLHLLQAARQLRDLKG